MPGQPQASPARSQPARRPRHEADSQSGPGEARRRDVTRPLPDPVAIRLCQVPDTTPPYDDEAPGQPESEPRRADALAGAIVATLGRGDRLRCAADAHPGTVTARRAGTPGQARTLRQARIPGQARISGQADTTGQARAASQADTNRQADRSRRAPGSADWPSRFAQVLAETLAGSRPPAQIAPWTTERARSHIRRLGPLLTAGQRPLVQRVITSAPSADVVEMSVVVGFGPRERALAVRLERTQGRPATAGRAARPQRWLCTAVEAA